MMPDPRRNGERLREQIENAVRTHRPGETVYLCLEPEVYELTETLHIPNWLNLRGMTDAPRQIIEP